MTAKNQRYEASVKLSNGKVVQYHNINTGLFKFHRFVCSKFNDQERWISYSVRRKENKEIVGNFKNSIPSKIQKNVSIFTQVQENEKKTGFFVTMKFSRNNFETERNMFVANHLVINKSSVLITIPEWLFEKMIYNGRLALFNYYTEKQHQVLLSEFSLGNMIYLTETENINEIQGTEPTVNYP